MKVAELEAQAGLLGWVLGESGRNEKGGDRRLVKQVLYAVV